jgi:hypothetical protein
MLRLSTDSQSTLVIQLNEHKYFSLFLSLASNAATTIYNDFNVLILDCWFLIFRGTDPNELAKDQQRVSRNADSDAQVRGC